MDSGRLISDSSSGGRLILLGGGSPIFGEVRSVVVGVAEGGSKKRSFFTSPDETFEKDYNGEQLLEKKRRLTPEQVRLLERSFNEENKLEPERKSELARKLGLQPRQVAIWFQNRRARWKNKQLEQGFDQLKSSYDALLLHHNTLLKDNNRLRSQVNSLIEKLRAKEQEASGQVTGLTPDAPAASCADLTALDVRQKVEDDMLMSTGSGGGAVVKVEETGAHHPVEGSRESYLPESYHCVGLADGGIHSEEDDMSDEGCSYYPDGIMFTEHHQEEEEEEEEARWSIWN